MVQITIDLSPEIINAIADAVVARLHMPKPSIECSRTKWLTHSEAAEYIRKTPAALYKITSQRLIKFSKRGKQNLYLKEYLDAYLNDGHVKTVGEINEKIHLITKPK